jgi:hypothetical protein
VSIIRFGSEGLRRGEVEGLPYGAWCPLVVPVRTDLVCPACRGTVGQWIDTEGDTAEIMSLGDLTVCQCEAILIIWESAQRFALILAPQTLLDRLGAEERQAVQDTLTRLREFYGGPTGVIHG